MQKQTQIKQSKKIIFNLEMNCSDKNRSEMKCYGVDKVKCQR